MENLTNPNWAPFRVLSENEKLVAPRPMKLATPMTDFTGVGDRLRSAAFAEIQAEAAFLWAASTFDAPLELRQSWRHLGSEESKHKNWLLNRMKELHLEVTEIANPPVLWSAFMNCKSATEFACLMADAENRGRKAGERFYEVLRNYDLQSAEIFKQIAEEEKTHIELTYRFFPKEMEEFNAKKLARDLRP